MQDEPLLLSEHLQSQPLEVYYSAQRPTGNLSGHALAAHQNCHLQFNCQPHLRAPSVSPSTKHFHLIFCTLDQSCIA